MSSTPINVSSNGRTSKSANVSPIKTEIDRTSSTAGHHHYSQQTQQQHSRSRSVDNGGGGNDRSIPSHIRMTEVATPKSGDLSPKVFVMDPAARVDPPISVITSIDAVLVGGGGIASAPASTTTASGMPRSPSLDVSTPPPAYQGYFDSAAQLIQFTDANESTDVSLFSGPSNSKEDENPEAAFDRDPIANSSMIESLDSYPKLYPQTTRFYKVVGALVRRGEFKNRRRIFLMRHGETDPNNRRVLQGSGLDESLNIRGKEQALVLAQYLSAASFDIVISSDLKRSRETAEIVASRQDEKEMLLQNFRTIPELREIHWGDWEGKRSPDMSALLASWKRGDFEAKPPGPDGESPMDCVRRAIPALCSLVTSLPANCANVAIVAHGRLIRIILSYLLQRKLDNMSNFHHHNCCINVIEAVELKSDIARSMGIPETTQKSKPERIQEEGSTQRDNARPSIDDPTTIVNPRLAWIPLVLDDNSFLPDKLQNT